MLTPGQLSEFHENGFVFIGQVATDEEFQALVERCDDIMQGRIQYKGMSFQLDWNSSETMPVSGGFQGPSDNYRKIQGWERDPVFLSYLQHSIFHGITRQLIGEDVSIFRSMFMNKPAGRGTYLPYHQDGGTNLGLSINDGSKYATVWTALDDASIDNGCVQIVPGSHKLGLLSEQGLTISEEQELEHAPDEKSHFIELKAGEVVVLHNYLLHRSGVNRTDRPRRGFSVCYMEAAICNLSSNKHYPVAFGENALRIEEEEVVGV